MEKELTAAQIKELSDNFTRNDHLPGITQSALITLEELEAFVAKIRKQKADSVRICFLRFEWDKVPTEKIMVDGKEPEGCSWRKLDNGFTQATIAIVPTRNFDMDENYIFSADDIIVDGKITALMPGIANKGTGLNPPPPPPPPPPAKPSK